MEDALSHRQAGPGATSRHAACLSCRKVKVKCNRLGVGKCERCTQKNLDCTISIGPVGRQKGTRNKRKGLDKAFFQVEQAIRNAGSVDSRCQESITRLQNLLLGNASGTVAPFDSFSEAHTSSPDQHEEVADDHRGQLAFRKQSLSHEPLTDTRDTSIAECVNSLSSSDEGDDEDLPDAQNPLEVIANATLAGGVWNTSNATTLRGKIDAGSLFWPVQLKLDVGPELDPIDLGLVTTAEAESLFNSFHRNLSHTRWGMDSQLHTLDFVRSRSAFLFTSILAAAAMFDPDGEAICKRLSNHRKHLTTLVYTQRYRSVEIALAFMFNVPWMNFGRHWADDDTCSYVTAALTIAMDLSMHKVLKNKSAGMHQISWTGSSTFPGCDTILPEKALLLDGFEDVNPDSELGRRLLRRRERVWLSLFVLERGACLSRGRLPVMPVTPLIDSCDSWHISDLADKWDSSIASIAVMRRDLPALVNGMRTYCNTLAPTISHTEAIAKLKSMVDSFFDTWHAIWSYSQSSSFNPSRSDLPPYVRILASHARLSVYSSIMVTEMPLHSRSSPYVRQFLRAATLTVALNVMKTAVHGEKELQSMPNNTAIMIAFAACVVMVMTRGSRTTVRKSNITVDTDSTGLHATDSDFQSLVLQTADSLERIGTTVKHRDGMSAIYARHLRELVNVRQARHAKAKARENESQQGKAQWQQPSQSHTTPRSNNSMEWFSGTTDVFENMFPPDSLLFSAMSDLEFVERLQNEGVDGGQVMEMSAANFEWLGDTNYDFPN